eukprot:scaffold980_cov248-Pinguiococcus_pyrenoidosus.AAC.11
MSRWNLPPHHCPSTGRCSIGVLNRIHAVADSDLWDSEVDLADNPSNPRAAEGETPRLLQVAPAVPASQVLFKNQMARLSSVCTGLHDAPPPLEARAAHQPKRLRRRPLL